MFNPIDSELFPEDCRVVYLSSCNQWIYWIQKNGSSSLREEHIENNCPLLRNEEIKNLDTIHVYIREPRDRYISGVHTYLEFLHRDHPDLDRDTALWFVKKYKFFNRHYMPQIFWIATLSKYINDDTKIVFHRLDELHHVTKYDRKPRISPVPDHFGDRLLKEDQNIELWFYIDQVLFDLQGKTMTWKDVQIHYRLNHPQAWNFLSQNVLP